MDTLTLTRYTTQDAYNRGQAGFDEGKGSPGTDGTFLASLRAAGIGTQPGITGQTLPYLTAWAEGFKQALSTYNKGFDAGYNRGPYIGLTLKPEDFTRYQAGYKSGAQTAQDAQDLQARTGKAVAAAMSVAEFEIQYKAVLWACETSMGHPGQTLREWLMGQDWQGQTVEALAEAWDDLDIVPDDKGWDHQND